MQCIQLNELLDVDVDVELRLCVDSKDLFTYLCTRKNSIDKSIRGNIGSIRFEFQTGAVDKIS